MTHALEQSDLKYRRHFKMLAAPLFFILIRLASQNIQLCIQQKLRCFKSTVSTRDVCVVFCPNGVCSTQIQPRSIECRRKQDDCDLAEYCDGKSATCPEDVFTVNGLPCDKGLGYCYNGQCPQRAAQCKKVYGNGKRLCFGRRSKVRRTMTTWSAMKRFDSPLSRRRWGSFTLLQLQHQRNLLCFLQTPLQHQLCSLPKTVSLRTVLILLLSPTLVMHQTNHQ